MDGDIGEPVEIVRVVENGHQHQYELNQAALSKILEKNGVGDKPLAVVSVAGDLRKGKSFLLNFMIRYLESGCTNDWMDRDKDKQLRGFPWRGGSERTTTGILVWSKVYTVKAYNKEVAVMLMDTQGTFDNNSTVRDCATIFGLSLMVSSVTVYNLMHNLQENDLQHLNLFAEYGRMADKDQATFQKLLFLIRDWQNPYEAPYGEIGGKKKLKEVFQISADQHPELQELRRNLKSCFEKMDCFLMPHPGSAVFRPNFHGAPSDLGEEFAEALQELIPLLLSPKTLLIKYQGGVEVKAKDMVRLFSAYVDTFKGEDLPKPETLLEATIKATYTMSLEAGKEIYLKQMQDHMEAAHGSIPADQLDGKHAEIENAALAAFHQRKKVGKREHGERYLDQLNIFIKDQFQNIKRINDAKRAVEEAAAEEIAAAAAREKQMASEKAATEAAAAKEREDHEKRMGEAEERLKKEQAEASQDRAKAEAKAQDHERKMKEKEEEQKKERQEHVKRMDESARRLREKDESAARERAQAAVREEEFRRQKADAEAAAAEQLQRIHAIEQAAKDQEVAAAREREQMAVQMREMERQRAEEAASRQDKAAVVDAVGAVAGAVGAVAGAVAGAVGEVAKAKAMKHGFK